MLYGAIEFGMIEENVNQNRLIFRQIAQNTTIHVPQGECTNLLGRLWPKLQSTEQHISALGLSRSM